MGAVGAAPSPAPGGGRWRNPDSGLNHSALEKQVQEGRRRSLDQKKKKKKLPGWLQSQGSGGGK